MSRSFLFFCADVSDAASVMATFSLLLDEDVGVLLPVTATTSALGALFLPLAAATPAVALAIAVCEGSAAVVPGCFVSIPLETAEALTGGDLFCDTAALIGTLLEGLFSGAAIAFVSLAVGLMPPPTAGDVDVDMAVMPFGLLPLAPPSLVIDEEK